MAFPATYNIQYYKGDTYQFVIRPKNSSGAPFVLPSTEYQVNFYIATSRGDTPTQALAGSSTITQTTYAVTTKLLQNNIATLTTSTNHRFVVGESVAISGVDATFNGNVVITAVPTSNTFSYAKVASNVTSTAVSPNGSVVSLNPAATDAVTCTITPAQGNQLDPTKTYVYDVSVTKDSGATVYTLLTGSISIVDDVAAS